MCYDLNGSKPETNKTLNLNVDEQVELVPLPEVFFHVTVLVQKQKKKNLPHFPHSPSCVFSPFLPRDMKGN